MKNTLQHSVHELHLPDVQQHASAFFRVLMSGNSSIRISAGNIYIPENLDRNQLKLVGKNLVATYREEAILPYEQIAYSAGFIYPVGTLVEKVVALVNFFMLSDAKNRERVSVRVVQKSQELVKVLQPIAHELLDEDVFSSPHDVIKTLLPVCGITLQLRGDGEREVIKKTDSNKQIDLARTKEFLCYFAVRQQKEILGRASKEILYNKLLEAILLHCKLHLKQSLVISTGLLHQEGEIADIFRALHKAGILLDKPVTKSIPGIVSHDHKHTKHTPRKFTTEHHNRIFNEQLLEEMGYKNTKSLYPQLLSALCITPDMKVLDVTNALHALSDAQHYELKKSNPIIFHTYQKLFEQILLEMNPHYTRKRFMVKSTR